MKTIDLTQGHVALVDDGDYPLVRRLKWYAAKRGKTWYAACNSKNADGSPTLIYMHRVIVGATPDQQVDHRDGNGLNNQRQNIRFCTNAGNQANSRPHNRRGWPKGVRWKGEKNKWQARIVMDGRERHLGYFDTPEEASAAYDAAAKVAFGEFARLNAPEVAVA